MKTPKLKNVKISIPGFLGLDTIDIFGWINLCYGLCNTGVLVISLTSTQLNASSICPISSQSNNQKSLQTLPNAS